ncbi:hypothetical protein ACWEN6_20970 [Sphaerisporangium sp. NPDC004334]
MPRAASASASLAHPSEVAALHLAGRVRAGLVVPLGRGVGELVEEDEDGLPHVVQRARVEAEPFRLVGEAVPGHARAEPHGGLEGLQVTALGRLAPPDRAEDVGVPGLAGPFDAADEALERLVDRQAQHLEVDLVRRAGVLGDALLDLADHLVGEVAGDRAQAGRHTGRYGGPHDIPSGTVRSRLHRVRVKLRRALGGSDPLTLEHQHD